jgi:hypothetical protein
MIDGRRNGAPAVKLATLHRPAQKKDPEEESTLLYVLSHTTPHTNLRINKNTEA